MHATIPNALPRWRGFNLLYFFRSETRTETAGQDLEWIAEWGFDFVRLPMNYRLWTTPEQPTQRDEAVLSQLDEVVARAVGLGLHVNLNLHRAPGYSVNRRIEEPWTLWRSEEAIEAFCHQWRHFAERYADLAPEAMSFNLLNEPPEPGYFEMEMADYQRVMNTAASAIHQVDPDRRIIIDAVRWGRRPSMDTDALPYAQSCRGYEPAGISHYQASWVDGETFDEPRWPGALGWERRHRWDRSRLEEDFEPWVEMLKRGVGVHCGEFGCYNRTPHGVALAWMTDLLEILRERGIGWALWNLRGPFGILDSGRDDVNYDDHHGVPLDRALLELLQAH